MPETITKNSYNKMLNSIPNCAMKIIPAVSYFFLIFSHAAFMVTFILWGWATLHRKLFYQASCLLVMSILINFVLKCTFQLPLPTTLNKVGFAFPSGHMQSVVVFYGWLAWKFKQGGIKACVAIIWIGTALSLHYWGYHDYFDLIGGALVGIGFIIFYNALSVYVKQNVSAYLFLLACLLMLYVDIHHGMIPGYVWQAYVILIGLLIYDKVKGGCCLK